MNVFVNYDGPKLDSKQKKVVRSQVMVVVRGQQRKQAKKRQSVLSFRSAPDPLRTALVDWHTRPSNEPRLQTRPMSRPRGPIHAPPVQSASTGDSQSSSSEDDVDGRIKQAQTRPQTQPLVARRTAHGSRMRNQVVAAVAAAAAARANPWDIRGAPPASTHATGVDARTFSDYISRCGAYSAYLDEAFVLVGFRRPSYFRPDLSKAACIYIGWLLTAGVLDAVRGARGAVTVAYPAYEFLAVRELQRFIDGADERALHEVVYPVVVLGMFEMVRFSPRAVTHLAAVERFVKSRGGLSAMPLVMQHLVVMGDILECVCLDTPLAFHDLGRAPELWLATEENLLAGDQLLSSPFLLCNDEDLSLVSRYAGPGIRVSLFGVLQAATNSFRQFFQGDGLAADRNWDEMASISAAPNDVPGLLLETCALATRIMARTLSGDVDAFDSPLNELDALLMYDKVRFIGLKAWKGLPYVYVWVNLVGFAASKDACLRSYFIAEVVRCAFSYGCYQIGVFQGMPLASTMREKMHKTDLSPAVLKNFLHLRNAIARRKMVLSDAAARS